MLLLLFMQPEMTVVDNSATVHFPSSIDFHLDATSSTPLESAEIEVRTGALSCGSGTTRAAPDKFSGGTHITADWTWELRQTGALPPGTVITWTWDAQTADGQTVSTPEKQATLEDNSHQWQSLETSGLRLSWYAGDQSFAQELQQAAQEGIQDLTDTLGVSDDRQISVYLYDSTGDMQSSTLYAPGWSGGLAFSAENTLLLAVAPQDLTWGKRAIKHELTHIIVDRDTYSCVTSTPTWFEEGLAMYFEGPPDPTYTQLLDDAVKSDTLLSVRELESSISGDPTLASLSYAESASLVSFLIDHYGTDKLLLLLDQWKQGSSQDKALRAVYGLDRAGLEAAWRQSLGAAPMKPLPASVGVAPTPYPTLIPLAGAPQAATEIIPTPAYLSAPAATVASDNGTASPGTGFSQDGYILMAIGAACVGLVLLALLVGVGIWLIRRRRPPDASQMS